MILYALSLVPFQKLDSTVRKGVLSISTQGWLATALNGDRFATWDHSRSTLTVLSLSTGKTLRRRLDGFEEPSDSMVLDAKGRVTLAMGQEIVRVGLDGKAVRMKVYGNVQAVGPDGTAVVVRRDEVGLWKEGRFRALPKLPSGGGGGTFRFSPSGASLLRLGEAPGESTWIETIDVASARVVRRTSLKEYDVRVASWAGEKGIVLAGEVGWVERFDARTLRSLVRVRTLCALNVGGSTAPDGRTFFGQGAFPLPTGTVAGVGIFDLVRGRYVGVVPNDPAPYAVIGVDPRRYLFYGSAGFDLIEVKESIPHP